MVYLLQLVCIYHIWLFIIVPSDNALALQSCATNYNTFRRGSRALLSLSSPIHYDDWNGVTNGEGQDDLSSISPTSTISTANNNFPRLQTILASIYSESSEIISTNNVLQRLLVSGFHNDNDVIQFAKGFLNRQEIISKILIQDFGWDVLDAHRARVALVALVCDEYDYGGVDGRMPLLGKKEESSVGIDTKSAALSLTKKNNNQVSSPAPSATAVDNDEVEPKIVKQTPWKSVLVNDKAKQRRRKDNGASSRNGYESTATISTTTKKKDSYNYGLQAATSDDDTDRLAYTNLYSEMEGYWRYMTVPQTSMVVDSPIREQTAKVYMTHARLFLGWIVDARGVLLSKSDDDKLLSELSMMTHKDEAETSSSPASTLLPTSSHVADNAESIRMNVWKQVLERTTSLSMVEKETLQQRISLYDIIPSSDTESAAPFLQYVLWLRSEREISPNYEANVLRGMIKLVKYRFAHEMMSSNTSSTSQKNIGAVVGRNTVSSSIRSTALDDLPIVIELRRLHREAGNKGKKAPRSSDEKKKWMEWNDYLEVIQLLKCDLEEMIDTFTKRGEVEEGSVNDDLDDEGSSSTKNQKSKTKSLQVQRKEIATLFQHYLILSFFACVPDRQRTFRELEINKNFIRVDDDSGSIWVIKHSADDYKTGSTYGERPPLPLTTSLTAEIDDFIHRFRPALFSSTAPSHLFLQPRTGNALTSDSVYQIVSRCCYKYKQKKTNPHLLRDMIVTHVRKNGDASEKELEALALFMGHSINMQRESYDRRTLEQKVSPAVKLMQDMNSMTNGGTGAV